MNIPPQILNAVEMWLFKSLILKEEPFYFTFNDDGSEGTKIENFKSAFCILNCVTGKSDLIHVEFQLQFLGGFFHNFCLKYHQIRQLIIRDLFLVVSGKPESPVFSLGTFF